MKTRNHDKPSRASAQRRWPRGRRATQATTHPPAINFQTILLAIDFSAPTQIVMRYAKSFARQFGARLVVLHVVEPAASAADFGYGPAVCQRADPCSVERSQEHLHAIERRQLDSECRFNTLVRSGIACDEIAKAAKELKADLIIITTHGHPGVKHAPPDSTAERLIRCSACPVLVVPEKEPVFIPQRATARSHYENQTCN
jgi:nucleotide-binding universal stress UspA family protein